MLALAGAGAFFAWRPSGGSATEAAYRTAPVDRGTLTAAVRATGTVNPIANVIVGSQLSGQVVEILADHNSLVKAGQVVARLDATQIQARRDAAAADLEQARADLGMRRAQVDRVRATRQRQEAALRDLMAQRDRAAAQLADARRTLDRQTELMARNIASQATLDTARTQADVTRAGLASAEAQIASQKAELTGLDADIALAEAQVQSAEAAILQRQAKLRDAEIDLGRTVIRSPVDGVVVQRQIDLGQTVAASLNAPTLFTIAQDLAQIEVWANIDEADVGRLKPGQAVSFTVSAYPARTFHGTVKTVRLAAQNVQNVVTYTGVIGVENRDLALLPGMTANLQVVTDERRDVLRVPNAAIRYRPANAAPAAAGPAGAEGGQGGRSPEALRARLMAEFQPTPEQAAAIDAVLAEMRGRLPAREPGLSDEERRAAMRRYREEMRSRIAALLDPERRARYEAFALERRPPAADTGMPGRVHVLDAEGQPAAVSVRLGVTDGAVTELISGEIKEGAAVIVGGGPRATADQPAPQRLPRGPRMF